MSEFSYDDLREALKAIRGDVSWGEVIPLVQAGVSVVLFKYIAGSPLVLMGKRKGTHGAGEFAFPGGRLAPNESPLHCAGRELQEEIGVDWRSKDLEDLQVDKSQPFNNTLSGGQPWITLFFTGNLAAGVEPKLMEPDRCEGWDYYSIENLPGPLFQAAYEYAHAKGWNCQTHLGLLERTTDYRTELLRGGT
jgi:8-oxo-dGTP diphosphatase